MGSMISWDVSRNSGEELSQCAAENRVKVAGKRSNVEQHNKAGTYIWLDRNVASENGQKTAKRVSQYFFLECKMFPGMFATTTMLIFVIFFLNFVLYFSL